MEDEKFQWPPRDGTSQVGRYLPGLGPENFPVDGRSVRQLLKFAQDYSKELKYFDVDGDEHGNWGKFLPDDVNLEDVERFIVAPETIKDDRVRKLFARPHLVLFLTFLKLLGRTQERMNGFTRRHLEFYYRQVLRLSAKPGGPDQVHVLVELAGGEENFLLPGGTLLDAGKDSQGADLFYRTDLELLANRAQVVSLKSLFVHYQPGEILDSAGLRAKFKQRNKSGGLEAAILFAIGDPEPGDPLPQVRKFADLSVIRDEQYIREKLFLERANFEQVKAALLSSPPLPSEEVDKVYGILEQAMRRKHGWLGPEFRNREWKNIFAASDATRLRSSTAPDDSEGANWRTFGDVNIYDQGRGMRAEPATIGFAVSSPLLQLGEGKRIITLTLAFEKDSFDKAAIDNLFKQHANPFRFLLSNGLDTFQVDGERMMRESPAENICFKLNLAEQVPPVSPPMTEGGIRSPWPVLQVLLADIASEDGKTSTKYYRTFRPLVLEKVQLEVEVSGITGLALQNDNGVLDATKPFEPFGTSPVVGSGFNIANAEICAKKLDALSLEIDWMGVPDNLHDYYLGYTADVNPDKSPIADNTAFTATLRLHDNRADFAIDEVALFHADYDNDTIQTTGASAPAEITLTGAKIKEKYPGYGPNLRYIAGNETFDWIRYWQLELSGSDFLNTVYPRAAANGAMRQANGKPNPYVVNPPYTPKIKRLTVGYRASVEIDPAVQVSDAAGQLFHIEPFGYSEIAKDDGDQQTFLPRYDNEGELYIGIANAQPPQSLSLLFQLADGSADSNPDIELATMQWSYLSGNRWLSLEEGDLKYDGTRGLIKTGIVKCNLPPAESNTLLPATLYWIRVAVVRNTKGVADTVAIAAQAITATRVDNDVAADYPEHMLAAKSIAKLATPRPEVDAIHQPYPSFGGRAQERPGDFYTRVSERLRHKNRALTVWDYERLILERFPQVYKAKCIPAVAAETGDAPSGVRIVVIPDIRNNVLSDPFSPKAPVSLLAEIKAFLLDRMPSTAKLTVRNADFVPVKLRFSVSFMPSAAGDEGYYLHQLNDEINRFLSPWAYDHQADIAFGQRVYANDIVNFIDSLAYVDYVAEMTLFKWKDQVWSQVKQGIGGYVVTTDRREEVLVAARQHAIDTTTDYEDEIFAGIGYMKIGLDLVVA